MTNPVNHYPSSSVTLSVMISEAIYRAVVSVERVIRLVTK